MPLSSDPDARQRQLANLSPPWKPGESANPGGKRGPLLTPLIANLASLPFGDVLRIANDENAPAAERMAATAWVVAMNQVRGYGDRAREQLLERLDGPIPKTLIYNEQRAEFADVQRNLLDKVERLLSQPVDDTQTAGDDTQA